MRYIVGLCALIVVAGGAIAVARRTPAQQIITSASPQSGNSATTISSSRQTPPRTGSADPESPVSASTGSAPATSPAVSSPPAPAPAAAAAVLPVLKATAPVVAPTEWINTPGLAPADLGGKVVLYEFWTFGCYNCKNVLPYVKAWHARYAKDGLIVVSIHSPEFDYERKTANVQKFVTENDITYPVALDPDMAIWRSFNNHYWPNMYLHDQGGQRRYEHIGEGAYTETENAIRLLLGVDPSSPRAVKPA